MGIAALPFAPPGGQHSSPTEQAWFSVTVHEGLPVTTVGRTLFDLAEVTPFGDLKKTTEAADRRNLLQMQELEQVCERGRGRRALEPVRRLIAELAPPDEGRSPLEIRFAAFVREVDPPWPAAIAYCR